MDDLSPLPSFTRTRTARVQGPRPCSWITSPDEHDLWPLSYHRANLSRTSSESTHSHHSSQTSFSSSVDSTPNIPLDHDAQSTSRTHRSRRRKPAGPRSRRDVPPPAVRPALPVRMSLPVEIDKPPQQLETSRQPAPPGSPRLLVPELPPLSPTDYLLDWDVIFEVLNI